jgi:hypothetical protein
VPRNGARRTVLPCWSWSVKFGADLPSAEAIWGLGRTCCATAKIDKSRNSIIPVRAARSISQDCTAI